MWSFRKKITTSISHVVAVLEHSEEANLFNIGVLDINKKEFLMGECSTESIEQCEILNQLKILNKDNANIQLLVEFPLFFEENSSYHVILSKLPQFTNCEFIHGVFEIDNRRMIAGIGAELDLDNQIENNIMQNKINKLIVNLFEKTHRTSEKIMYLQPNISKCYYKFIFDTEPSLREILLAASVIGYNKNIFRFFFSSGIVHSSQDIVQTLKYNFLQGRVVSGNEVFILEPIDDVTDYNNIDKIYMKYELSKNKYACLEENDKYKFSLLEICKKWKIKLYCENVFNKDINSECVVYDPTMPLIDWLIK